MAETKSIKIDLDEEENNSRTSQLQNGENDFDNEPNHEEINSDAGHKPALEVEIDYEAELESAQKEAKENYDRLLRVSAEFENYKKRTTREQTEFRKYANEALIKDLLSVVDNLERAIVSVPSESEEVTTFLKGVELTLQEILKILRKHNVSPIEAIGNPFDPCFHQAVMQTESTAYPVNTVIEELQKGYLIFDRLLRPAMVVVSKSPSTADEK
jgi:molecular chaperone GrpE